ncbi:MAG: hypothetical protein JRN06_08205 [Nitrososphaerota archaeon]|nr:hypothetical protein [Nitrososphaerota archaeon]MDG7024235.1 hypothetical protein [Nitrososphaerota archaeon]
MVKSVKVHEETHRALKLLKARQRKRSIDQVIREMIRASAGVEVEKVRPDKSEELTRYLKD